MLEKIKNILRVKSPAFDEEIQALIDGAKYDLELTAGVVPDESNPLIFRAIATYCRANFSSPSDYDNLKKSYDEQKAQLQCIGISND